MIKPSELQILVLWLSLAPLFMWMNKGIDWRGKHWFAATLICLTLAYVATVTEGFFAESLTNIIEHALYAVTGVLFAIACTSFLRRRHPRESLSQ